MDDALVGEKVEALAYVAEVVGIVLGAIDRLEGAHELPHDQCLRRGVRLRGIIGQRRGGNVVRRRRVLGGLQCGLTGGAEIVGRAR